MVTQLAISSNNKNEILREFHDLNRERIKNQNVGRDLKIRKKLINLKKSYLQLGGID